MKQTTNKRKCPECGCNDVVYQGHSVGSGVTSKSGKSPEANKHNFKCSKCGKEFHYTGKL